MTCPLCKTDRIVADKRFAATKLIDSYSTLLGLNVAEYYPSDSIIKYHCLNCDLRFFTDALPGDGPFYDRLQKLPFYYEAEKPEFDFAIAQLDTNGAKKVLEIGAGTGHFIRKAQTAFACSATELSPESLKSLEAQNIKVDNVVGETYDAACTFQVLEHIVDPDQFLSFIDKKVTPGGLIIISVPNNDSPYCRETFDPLDMPPHHMLQFSEKALRNVAKRMNYEVISYWTEPLRFEHYLGMVMARRAGVRGFGSLLRKLFKIIDIVVAPYFYFATRHQFPGHTHAVVCRKAT